MGLIQRLAKSIKSKVVIPSIALLALTIVGGVVIYQVTQATVVFAKDGEVETIKTHAHTVEDLFDTLDINVSEHDEISESLNTTIEDGMEIEYKTAKEINVTIDEEFSRYYTTAETIGDFFDAENISIKEHDEVSHKLTEDIVEDLHVEVNKAYEVFIVDGKEKEVKAWTTGGTVEDLLEQEEIKLKKHDKIKPALDETVEKDDQIKITRVKLKEKKITEEIDYKTEKKDDSSLEKGKEKVVTEGKVGELEKTYELTFENGKEVDRKLKDEKTTKEPKNEVISVGTKEEKKEQQEQKEQKVVQLSQKKSKSSSKPKSKKKSSNNSQPSSGGKEFTMNATAYTAKCSGCTGVTATGINLNNNPNKKVVAVDPSVIPLGSRVWVEGYGEAVAGDTGGAISGNRIDVHMPSDAAARQFGRKTVKVKVLD